MDEDDDEGSVKEGMLGNSIFNASVHSIPVLI